MPSAPTVSEAMARPGASRLALPLFVATIGLSAFLLFGVQPMFARMVLPILGGTPAVWSVATVFFQTALFAGYAYAHWLAGRSVRTGVGIQLGLMAAAALALPIAVAPGWRSAPADAEAVWLIGLFTISVGLPFVALAANGPLLQAWFARLPNGAGRDPYRLYGASNIGSFAALACYPVLVEPLLSLRDQSRGWTIGFGLLAVLIALCGALPGRGATAAAAARTVARPSWPERARWIGVSAVSSGLLVAVTAHISTDIVAMPLLWVVPLGLYLLSFVVAFRERSLLADAPLGLPQAGLVAIAIAGLGAASSLALGLALHLGLFVVCALICHRALYRSRPAAESLTDFYLCLSAGGALGGILCALAAPVLFASVIEYPVLLAAAILCRPLPADWRERARRDALPLVLGAAAAIGLALVAIRLGADPIWTRRVVMIAFVALIVMLWRSPVRSAALALAATLAGAAIQPGLGETWTSRSFFGVHRISTTTDGRFRMLAHGTTLHGAMRLLNQDGSPVAGPPEPTTYYGREAAIGTAIESARAGRGGVLASVSVIGLGAGSLACHARAGEGWTFYEIDAEVVRIARDPARFRFLSDCAPGMPVVLGDARLTLADSPPGQDLIVLDAFSSDAIPAHLITREAIGLYLSKLGPTGTLVMHVSNRHLDLTRIIARVAAEHGLVAHMRREPADAELFETKLRAAAIVMAVGRRAADLGPVAGDPGWRRVAPDMTRRPWTDDYSNVLEALVDHGRD